MRIDRDIIVETYFRKSLNTDFPNLPQSSLHPWPLQNDIRIERSAPVRPPLGDFQAYDVHPSGPPVPVGTCD